MATMASLSSSACIRLASLALCGALLYKAVSSRRNRVPPRAAFLGIDVSTQSCKLLVTDARRRVLVHSIAVNFERDLPHYHTTDGFIKQGRVVCAPSLMFVEALELALSQLHSRGFDFQTIVAVSASGQQHGSIWWHRGADAALDSLNLNPQQTLTATLKDSFSMPLAPIWMDSSTHVECSEMEHFVNGPERMASISGSRAYERFTGPQIRRRIKSQPEVYDNTERISLISSLVPTLLLGRYAPIDQADGSGTALV
jgi:xylulokinase